MKKGQKMTSKQEIEKFFKGYTKKQRERVEASPDYQKAIKEDDAAKALEVAAAILEGDFKSRQSAEFYRRVTKDWE